MEAEIDCTLQSNAWWNLVGVLLFDVLAGFTGLLMPTFLWPWGNLVIYPALLFILFVLAAGMCQNFEG